MLWLLFAIVLTLLTLTRAQNITNFIDKLSKVKSFDEKDWYLLNIPFVEIPDHNIEEIFITTGGQHIRDTYGI